MESLVVGDAFPVVAGVMQDVAVVACRVVFFLSAVLLMVLVLLQEGKGGGLASALGGQGAETFGVATGGVNKITLWLAGIFLASAVGHVMAYKSAVQAVLDENRGKSTPVKETPGGGIEIPPGNDDGQPPKKDEPAKDAAPKEEAPK